MPDEDNHAERDQSDNAIDLPKLLTAVAALITAVGASVLALSQSGLLPGQSSETEKGTTPAPPAATQTSTGDRSPNIQNVNGDVTYETKD